VYFEKKVKNGKGVLKLPGVTGEWNICRITVSFFVQ